jgi:hypothetical protein
VNSLKTFLIAKLVQLFIWNEKHFLLVSDGAFISGEVSTLLSSLSAKSPEQFQISLYTVCNSLILPMDVSISTVETPDFNLLQNHWSYLDISTVEYPTGTPFYNWYYIPELPNLTSLPSQCKRHSYSHTICAVRQCTTVDILWASVQREKGKELGVTYFPWHLCMHIKHILWTQKYVKHNTGMRYTTTFRSTTGRIYEDGPIIL